MAAYLDTSAFIKLVITEDHSGALHGWARGFGGEVFSSDLLRTEALRAARRHSPAALAEARRRLDFVTLVTLPTATFERAGDLDPGILRTLDAVHLAAALSVGDGLQGVVTYDDRLAAAAGLHGIPVISPR